MFEKNWDVMVVDEPSVDSPESPGRIASLIALQKPPNATLNAYFAWF